MDQSIHKMLIKKFLNLKYHLNLIFPEIEVEEEKIEKEDKDL